MEMMKYDTGNIYTILAFNQHLVKFNNMLR